MKKITKFFYNPGVLLFIWFAYLLSPLISALIYFLGDFIIPVWLRNVFAFIHKFTWITFLFSSFLVLALWIKKYVNTKLSSQHALTLLFVFVSAIIYDFIGNRVLVLEKVYYPNYLYSKFGLIPQRLTIMIFSNYVIIGAIIAFAAIRTRFQKDLDLSWRNTKILKVALSIIGLFILFAFSLYPFTNITNLVILTNDRYTDKFGSQFEYILESKKYIPKDATVIHPPQGFKWPSVGNQPVIRYFLFPRRLVSGTLMSNQGFAWSLGEPYFVKLPEGELSPVWPVINIKEKTVVFDEITALKYDALEDVSEEKGLVYKIKFP